MPSTLYNTVAGGNLGTALGGTINDGDTVYINDRADLYTAGLAINKDLEKLHVLPGFSGDIGDAAAGSALVADYDRTATGKLIYQGSGRYAAFRGYSAKLASSVHIAPASAACRVVFDDMAISAAVIEGGAVIANGNVDMDGIQMSGGTLMLQDSSNTASSLTVVGGRATCKRALTVAYVGQCAVLEMANASYALGAATVRGGGTLIISGASAVSGQIEIETGGVLDLARVAKPLTIATIKGWPRSRIIMPATASLITFSATAHVGSGPITATP